MDIQTTIYAFVGSIIAGYVGYHLLYLMLRLRWKTDRSSQKNEIVRDAMEQVANIKRSEKSRIDDDLQSRAEELEENINQRREDMKLESEDLDSRHSSLQREESRLQKMENDMIQRQERVDQRRAVFTQLSEQVEQHRQEYIGELGRKSNSDVEAVSRSIIEHIIDERKLQAQKALKTLDEELDSTAKRTAHRAIARSMARYAPEFYWPKSINFVEIASRNIVDQLAASEGRLIEDMKELAGIEVELLADNENQDPIVRLAGGFGVNREAVRLAMTEMFKKGQSTWTKSAEYYQKHREKLEQEAINLGKKAVIEVGLPDIHPEIRKLVGYLNWRTSYRQNQWYHTVEVAKLAGTIASELGIDVDAAKRCGLLHDIGKAIDYRIEGSHAVISGDYADRYGESRLICDTVMSHHNDLVLETPLSFVLKTADTLSGARPGARVNLEEGYQMRLSGIDHAIRSFPGVVNVAIMNGAREVHVEVNHKKVRDKDLEKLTADMAQKVSHDVAFPGEIKILVSRRYEATSVA